MKNKMSSNATKILFIVALVAFLIGSLFLYKGFDVKENYSNSDYYAENAYVGGDAYNYIISGTYFTGYAIIGIGFYVVATITFTGSIMILALNENTEVSRKEELPQI